MSLTLIIDTSLWGCSLGILDENDHRSWSKLNLKAQDSDTYIDQFLTEGLKSLGEELDQVKKIVISTGPGSFTGIRVGIAWVFGFSQPVKSLNYAPISSLKEAMCEISKENCLSTFFLILPMSRFELIVCHLLDGKINTEILSVLSTSIPKMFEGYSKEQLLLVDPIKPLIKSYDDLGLKGKSFSRESLASKGLLGIINRLKDTNQEPLEYGRGELDVHYLKPSSTEEKQ